MLLNSKLLFKNLTTYISFIVLVCLCACSQNKTTSAPPQEPIQQNNKNDSGKSSIQSGEASVYADKLHGKKTASGEIYDQNQATAASKTLPLGSTAKVTNKKTGKSTNVKITDRGPYVKGRSIDLSKAAAKEIDMDPKGVTSVEIEPVSPEQGK